MSHTKSRRQIQYPIIDSHIHLYAASHLKTLSWASSLPPTHPLNSHHTVPEYRKASSSQPRLLGFVFVETDRISSLSPNDDGWNHVFAEIEFLRRIKSNTLNPDEFNPSSTTPTPQYGSTSSQSPSPHTSNQSELIDSDLLLGIIPWSPVASPNNLELFLTKSNALADFSSNGLIRGVRYLLQDKPQGHMKQHKFHEGLLELERLGAKTFDLGVDFRQGGSWQLQEAIQMLLEFYSKSTGKLKIVVNHFGKPDLIDQQHGRPNSTERADGDSKLQMEISEKQRSWEHSIKALADFPTTYMKFSGLFSELPSQETTVDIQELVARTKFECDVVFENFGAENIMFGSDWPVCEVGGPGEDSWAHWVEYVAAVLDDQGLSEREKRRIWAETAKEVYDLTVDVEG